MENVSKYLAYISGIPIIWYNLFYMLWLMISFLQNINLMKYINVDFPPMVQAVLKITDVANLLTTESNTGNLT
jgi:hypothetical protein